MWLRGKLINGVALLFSQGCYSSSKDLWKQGCKLKYHHTANKIQAKTWKRGSLGELKFNLSLYQSQDWHFEYKWNLPIFLFWIIHLARWYKKKVDSTLAAICFKRGTREVWKCSVVIRKDTEEEEEAGEEVGVWGGGGGQRWLQLWLWEWREHIRPNRLCGLSSY